MFQIYERLSYILRFMSKCMVVFVTCKYFRMENIKGEVGSSAAS